MKELLSKVFIVVATLAVLVSISVLTMNVRYFHKSYISDSEKLLVCKPSLTQGQQTVICFKLTVDQFKTLDPSENPQKMILKQKKKLQEV